MPTIYKNECDAAGLNHKEVKRIANGLAKYAKQAEALGLTIFGDGYGSGTLRFADEHREQRGALILAQISEGMWDGGDGGSFPDSDGLERGEP
jgi:hypothetical protein